MIKELTYPTGKKIILIGTAHISKNSVTEVIETIEKYTPDVVAVELCDKRYDLEKCEFIRDKTTLKSAIMQGKYYYIYGSGFSMVQKQLALCLDTTAGDEMGTAIREAKKHGAEVALIDQDIFETLENMWNDMTYKEKCVSVVQLTSIAAGIKGLRKVGVKIEFDPDKLIEEIEKNPKLISDPNVTGYKELIEYRNVFLSENIKKVSKDTTIVVLGAGHIPGIMKILKEETPELEEMTYGKHVVEETESKEDFKCVVCGKKYVPAETGVLKRDVIKCECGNVRYFLGLGLNATEFRPDSKNDSRFLKLVFGKPNNQK